MPGLDEVAAEREEVHDRRIQVGLGRRQAQRIPLGGRHIHRPAARTSVTSKLIDNTGYGTKLTPTLDNKRLPYSDQAHIP